MFIPAFALRESEKEILKNQLTRTVNIILKEKLTAYVVDENQFEQIIQFVEEFRDIKEDNDKVEIDSNRGNIIRAVTTVFNLIVDAQKIKNPEIKTAAMASILSSITSILILSPEYGQRLISILRSKI